MEDMQKSTKRTIKSVHKTKLGVIPEDWNKGLLLDVCSKITDGTHDTPRPVKDGIPYITAIHVKSGNIDFENCYYLPEEVHEEIYRRCNPEQGDVLFVNIGAGTATAAMINVDYEFSLKNVALLKPQVGLLDGKYLEQFQIFYKPILERKYLTGNAQPFLSLKEIKKLPIHYPKLIEQKKIAKILSTWDEAIRKTEQVIQAKTQLKKGLMQQLLTGKKRFKEFEGDEWNEYTLRKLGYTFNGLTGKTKVDFGAGKPFIPYLNIINNSRVNPEQMDFVGISPDENQNTVQYGDVFFTTSSETPDDAGMSSVLLDDLEQTYLNSFCFGFRLHNFEILLPSFARFYLKSYLVRKDIFRLAQGSTRYNISKNEIMKIKLHLPSIKEQKRLASLLSNLEDELSILTNKVIKYKEQKKGLMQKLLTGELRVNN